MKEWLQGTSDDPVMVFDDDELETDDFDCEGAREARQEYIGNLSRASS